MNNTFMLKTIQIENMLENEYSYEDIGMLIVGIMQFVNEGTEPKFSDRGLNSEFKHWKEFWDYGMEKKEYNRLKKQESLKRKNQSEEVESFEESSNGKTDDDSNNSKNSNISNNSNKIKKFNAIDKDKAIAKDKAKDIKKENIKEKAESKFVKPTLQEIQEEINAKGYLVSASEFFNYYENVGWKIGGKTKMKNYKLALANWNSRNREKLRGKTRISDINERQYKKGAIEEDLNDPTRSF